MGSFRITRWLGVAGAAVVASSLSVAAGYAPADATATRRADERWVAAWAASPVVGTEIPGSSCPAGAGLRDHTVRNVVFVSVGGSRLRVRLTNAFGTQPLRIGHASVAVQQADATPAPDSLRELTFGGATGTVIPAGEELFSDPVALAVAPLSTLLISVHVPEPTGPVTNHPFTAQGNFLAGGDKTLAGDGAAFAPTPCWMLADGVDVDAQDGLLRGSVVALGDSITDTANTTGNANRRWPDFLARRLNITDGPTMSVVNAGLGGNRLLEPRAGEPYYGVPALLRLDRDVLAQSGARTVILLEGINDIGFDATADALIAGYREIAGRVHAAGLKIIGGTITPFGGSAIWSPSRQATWDAVNTWIRTGGAFDGVIDFAAATAVAGDPLTLDPRYDSGDHLHPNDAGTEAMANAVDVSALFPEVFPAAAAHRVA